MNPKIYPRKVFDTAKYSLNKIGNEIIIIKFAFSHDTLEKVKTLPNRTFNAKDPKNKFWTCPLSIEAVEKLKSWGFVLDDSLHAFLLRSKINIDELPEAKIPGLQKRLYPFQGIGVSFIEEKKGKALIADDMGLGKTVQAIAYLQLHKELRPALIVCPGSVKLNWARECHIWMEKCKVQTLTTQTIYPITGQILIINYDILPYWVDQILYAEPKIMILDEGHYIKNSKTKRADAIKKLRRKITQCIGLTGTPIENRPIEIYNLINTIDKTIFPNFLDFGIKYCDGKHNGFGWNFNGNSNTQELNTILKTTIMIRRLKSEVATQLPDKTYSIIPIELDNYSEYQKVENSFIDYIRFTKGEEAVNRALDGELFAKTELLKQTSAKGKLKSVIEWVEDFLESGEKLVLFAIHKFVIKELMEHFGKIAVKIDGETDTIKRQQAVDAFQTDPNIKLFVGNMKAAGVGITLTAAFTVGVVEFPIPENPAILAQAIDRVHRIVQKNAVIAHFFVAKDTIEEIVCSNLDEKLNVSSLVLDGKQLNEKMKLTNLVEQYK